MVIQDIPEQTAPQKPTRKVGLIIIPIILAIAVLVIGFFLFQNINHLKEANRTIDDNNIVISGLTADLSTAQNNSIDLQNQLNEATGTISSLNEQVIKLQEDKVVLENNLNQVNTNLASTQSSLSATQTINSSLTTELKKIKDPRHFSSLTELRDWLQKDDTNTQYASERLHQLAYILQVRALRDGFILPARYEYIDGTLYFSNTAIIEGSLYFIDMETDTPYYEAYTYAVPSHPEPLP